MTTQNRDTSNYYGETTQIGNAISFDTIYVTMTQFSLANSRVNLTFRGWNSADNFRERVRPNSRYERNFSPKIEDLADYAESIEQLKLSALEFMELSADKYEIGQINIDIENLMIDIRANHLEFSQVVMRSIRDAEEFEQLKQSNREILDIVLSFWTYAKTKDVDFLKHLKTFE